MLERFKRKFLSIHPTCSDIWNLVEQFNTCLLGHNSLNKITTILDQNIETVFKLVMIQTLILPFKDNDIMEANVSLGELQQKIKRLEGLCQVSASNQYCD